MKYICVCVCVTIETERLLENNFNSISIILNLNYLPSPFNILSDKFIQSLNHSNIKDRKVFK